VLYEWGRDLSHLSLVSAAKKHVFRLGKASIGCVLYNLIVVKKLT
jgi:hypothetical protein